MDEVLTGLADQHAELAGLIHGLDEATWRSPSPCEGWTVADVVLHLAQTDELAVESIRAGVEGRVPSTASAFAPGVSSSVDDAAEASVAAERDTPGEAIGERWRDGAARLRSALADVDPHLRVMWVAGRLSVHTLTATRLSEAWIHSGDVADALGVELVPGDRLRHVARLAWRTLPYAYSLAGLEPAGGFGFDLDGPDGARWSFGPLGGVDDDDPITTVTGSGVELCQVAGQRRSAAETSLVTDGPDAASVLTLVRTYAA